MLHYHVEGDPKRPCFLFLHGFLGDFHDWDGIVESFKLHAYCICADLPGHGLSSNERATNFDDAADAVVEVLSHAQVPAATLVGYSMGGRIALHTLLRHPSRFNALVMESATAGIAHDGERRARHKRDSAMADELETMELSSFLRWWYSQPMFASLAKRPDLLGSLLVRRGLQQPKELAAALRVFSPGVQPPLWNRLQDVRVPTLVIAGSDDPKYVVVAKSLYGRLLEHDRDAPHPRTTRHRLHIVPECGHNVHLEQPNAFVDSLLEMLSYETVH